MSEYKKYDLEKIRDAIPFPDLVGDSLGELSRCSGHHQAPCPFHDERTPSFHIYPDHGHCFGCGWHGDIFKFAQDVWDLDFTEAAEKLAGKCGIGAMTGELLKKYSVTDGPKRGSNEARTKPVLPPFSRLRPSQISHLAELRGLSPLGVHAAVEHNRVGFCEWPQWQRKTDGQWQRARDIDPAWVVTDDERWVVQFRRFSGAPYTINYNGKPTYPKAWTKGSAKWAIGCKDIGDKSAVMLVEGGADMLAAYHFLHGFGLLDKVAVVCMLGSSKIADDALAYFAGKRVRIMLDADIAKPGIKAVDKTPLENPIGADDLPIIPEGWKVPSMEAASRWQAQLVSVGAIVEHFSLYGLKTAAGARVTDLNDLALANAETLGSSEITDAFFAWDF